MTGGVGWSPRTGRCRRKRCMDGERDRVAFRRGEPLRLIVSQVGKHVRSASVLRVVRQPWHQVEVQVGEPIGPGELHEVCLHAAGDNLQCAAKATYEPTELVGCCLLYTSPSPRDR